MAWYPGAYAHDYGGSTDSHGNPLPCDPDSWVLHEVVNKVDIPENGTPSDIAGWVSGSKATQFYVDYDGDAEQYCDSLRASSHCKDGNGHRLGIETEDDKPQTAAQANAGTWKASQCERISDIIAWGNIVHGIPIRQMRTSRRADIGVGYHRLGVPQIAGGRDGWPDGELWTTSPGKPCPGDRRIAQIPGIIARALVIATAVKAGRCQLLGRGPFRIEDALARTGSTTTSATSPATAASAAETPDDSEDPDMFSTVQAAGQPAIYATAPGHWHPITDFEIYAQGLEAGLFKPVKIVANQRALDVIRVVALQMGQSEGNLTVAK